MLVVNFFAGSGCGKSTMAAGVFHELKNEGVSCELVTEFAKDLVWDGSTLVLKNHGIYVAAAQMQRLERLEGKVDVAITDSPILLPLVYHCYDNPFFGEMLRYEFNKYRNLNCVLQRVKPFVSVGRVEQHVEEAIAKDVEITALLRQYAYPYFVTTGDKKGKDIVLPLIKKAMKGTLLL